jgi:DNA helicase TIP49 (TBP-interacting protein)
LYKFSLGIVINEEVEGITGEVVDMEDREEAATSPYQQSLHSQLTLETYPMEQSKETLKAYLRT